MKRIITFIFVGLFAYVIVSRVALNERIDSVVELPQEEKVDFNYEGGLPNVKYSFGEKEDPNARIDLTLKQLADPKTGKIPSDARLKEFQFAKKVPVSKGLKVRSSNGRTQNLNLNFTSAGPNNVGGRTRALAIDVTNENIIFAGGVSGGLWRSTNTGSTWTRVSSRSDLP
ncbi:MAG: hypothetical protein AAFN93_17255, partial [Bacteroidota bacterium]